MRDARRTGDRPEELGVNDALGERLLTHRKTPVAIVSEQVVREHIPVQYSTQNTVYVLVIPNHSFPRNV